MYIEKIPTKRKNGEISHLCILLRESYRENGKVKKHTIANLTHCHPDEVAAMEFALEHKEDLSALQAAGDTVKLKQGKSAGAVLVLYEISRRLGIQKALGTQRAGKLALWQVFARIIGQGSRLSATRLAQNHVACDVLGLRKGFHEDHLYENLGWLSDNQERIEKKLLKARRKGKKPELFLYDVTSSYLEGSCNELGEWGYNRDGKKGKKQVVVGLLCDEDGEPVSVEVFQGNTNDMTTFGNQVKKAGERFGCHRVTFVGDRGMIKSGQIADLQEAGFHYITAITKPQIESMIVKGLIQRSLFEKDICEIEYDDVRYILRYNPVRAEEMSFTRKEKKGAVERLVEEKNEYLQAHPRAKVEKAQEAVYSKIKQLKVEKWLTVEAQGKELCLKEDKEALAKEAEMDGCYVIKSDLPKEVDKQTIHDRYKDLAGVEQAFRTCKSSFLEMRPWYVWSEKSTRGHAFVVMLAYLITHYLQEAWKDLNVTVEEGMVLLSTLCSTEIVINGKSSSHQIPAPNKAVSQLLKAAGVKLPEVLPCLGATVDTRKKLQEQRSNA